MQSPDSVVGRSRVSLPQVFRNYLPRTCASSSLLTARTASHFSSRYFPVLHSCLALRHFSVVFRVSLFRSWSFQGCIAESFPTPPAIVSRSQSRHSQGRRNRQVCRNFPRVSVCTPEQRTPGDGRYIAEFGWLAPSYETRTAFLVCRSLWFWQTRRFRKPCRSEEFF